MFGIQPFSTSSRLRQRLRGELAVALLRTFLARGVAALGSLLLGIVLGRLYGPEGVGIFALAQSVFLGAGLLARYGMDNTLMRYVGRNAQSVHVLGYLRWACTKALWISLTMAGAVFLARHWIALAFDAPHLAPVLVGIALAIPAFTLAFILAGFMKGINRPASACLLENGAISLIAATVIILCRTLFHLQGLALAGWGMALAAWLVLLSGALQIRCWQTRQVWSREEARIPKHELNSTSHSFLTIGLAQFTQQVVGVLIAGVMLSSHDLGLFKSAERLALLITFILMVINAVFPPRFAQFFHQGHHDRLERLARQGALLGIVMASPLLLVCFLAPGLVLQVFGAEFKEAANLLRVIAVGQLVNVATGSVGFLLNMTGHEKLMRNIALLCNSVGLLLFLILIPLQGSLGAALALAGVLMLQNLAALFFVWRTLGIWTLPLPNVLQLCGVRPRINVAQPSGEKMSENRANKDGRL